MIYELLKDRIINGSNAGSEAVIQSLSITANGTYTAPTGVDGYSPVVVAVPEVIKEVEKIVEVKIPPVLEDKNIASNGTFSASSGFDGLGTVVVNVPERVPVVESKEITANGTYTPNEGVDGFNRVVVNVPSSGGDVGKLKRVELDKKGQEYLFNNYFLDLLDYGCEIVLTNPASSYSFQRLAKGNHNQVEYIDNENIDKFASLKINLNGCRLAYGTLEMFMEQEEITHLPEIVGDYSINTSSPPQCQSMFYECWHLQEIPDNYIGLMFHDSQYNSWIDNSLYSSIYPSYMFYHCYALRKIPNTLGTLFHQKTVDYFKNVPQYWGFNECYSLGELVDFPVVDSRDINNPYTRNSFECSFVECQRLKRLAFKLDEQSHTEGNETITVYSPTTAYWKNQTIDLAAGQIGYGTKGRSYNPTLFSEDNRVIDDATYQALKNTEDWWTEDIAYSRYNHTSAVETINTLPQIPSTYTNAGNTIKFKGASGSATDGGAINTLTQEEIAVATAKGWTVALV